MSESIDSVELKALAKRYPRLDFEDCGKRKKPIRDQYKFLRFQATQEDLNIVRSPAIPKVFDGFDGVVRCRRLVAHAETVVRLADILAQRRHAQ